MQDIETAENFFPKEEGEKEKEKEKGGGGDDGQRKGNLSDNLLSESNEEIIISNLNRITIKNDFGISTNENGSEKENEKEECELMEVLSSHSDVNHHRAAS